ncbi:MAG: hypothetical protein JNL97_13500, partial [Verrucomicrobiales bacterium]|nr:hypothetical protein [Verrucomicrobiales bacterium]
WAGARFGEGSGAWRDRFGFGAVLIASGVLAIRFVPGWLARGVAALWRCAGGHWRRWEFWPAALFYLPVAANYVRLAVRYRGLTLPVAANPGMAFGGVVGESKYATLRELYERDPDATAESWLLSRGETEDRCAAFRRLVAEAGIEFPLILKPDLGQRGLGVRRIGGLAEGEAYLRRTSADVVVQRYDPGPFEAGVFYYRFPGEERGRLFAITEKIFPSVVGDGVRTLEELVRADARARWIADRYLRRLGPRVSEVPPPGRSVPLVATGNHAQGCIFRDGWRWWTPELEQRFDAISRRLPGFFVGRYDVRFGDEEEFRSGRGFRIVELNGASAEATSIYDERHSIRTAYATLFRQWDLVFAIGAANRARGIRSVDPATLWRAWRDSSRLFATYPSAD